MRPNDQRFSGSRPRRRRSRGQPLARVDCKRVELGGNAASKARLGYAIHGTTSIEDLAANNAARRPELKNLMTRAIVAIVYLSVVDDC